MAQEYLDLLKKSVADVPLPSIEVRYDDVSYTVSVPERSMEIPNVFKQGVDILLSPLSLVGVRGKYAEVPVLKSVSGVLRPGSSTVIIGAPGSGKTSLLRMIANRVSGTNPVLYNGKTAAAVRAEDGVNFSKIVSFAPAEDVHEPLLTVKETLSFAHFACSAPAELHSSTIARSEVEQRVDAIINVLGLRECANTIAGNQQFRGISGGQKRRLTVAECLLSAGRILALDQPTDGLDARVATDLCAFLADFARTTQGVVVAALQAPTPEMFQSFDDVILLGDGQILYHGPVADVEAYLAGHGYLRPAYSDLADFLVSLVTSPALAARVRGDAEPDALLTAPPIKLETLAALAAAWRDSTAFKTLMDGGAKAAPQVGIKLQDPYVVAQYSNNATSSFGRIQKQLLQRQMTLVKRNPVLVVARINQAIVNGLIIGSLFLFPDSNNFPLRFGLALFAAVSLAFGNMAEVPVVATSKRVVYRHTAASYYGTFQYMLSVILTHMPFAFIANVLFSSLLFGLSSWAGGGARWAFFVFVLYSHELAMSALFRVFAFLAPSQELGQALAGASTGVFLVFGGFLISYPLLPPYTWPLYYLSPFSWTVKSLAVSEFNDDIYQVPVAPFPGAPLKGDVFLSAFGMGEFNTMAWKWAGPAFLLAYWLLFGLVIGPLVLRYLRYDYSPGQRRTPEPLAPSQAVAGPAPTVNPLSAAASGAASSAHHALAIMPVTLAFKDITYDVFNPRTKKEVRLLRGVSGFVRPGTMLCLQGASGAGKTTLLETLSFRKTQGKIGGSITLNGYPATAEDFRRVSAYVEQEPVLWDRATVEESVRFVAELKLDVSISAATKHAFVEELLEVLELVPVRNRVVSSLSLGELKRVSIGVELASNPSVLFLDEPVTGLDARSAAVVMRVIKNVAVSRNVSVVCTIHQPNTDTFFSFSHLLLLQPGGYQAVHIELGTHAAKLIDYLQAIPTVPRLPHGVNPATWMLQVVAPEGDADSSPLSPTASTPALALAADDAASAKVAPAAVGVRVSGSAVDFPAVYAASDVAAANSRELTAYSAPGAGDGAPQVSSITVRTPGFAKQFGLVFWRSVIGGLRNPQYNTLRTINLVVISLLFGLVYLNIDRSDQQGVLGTMAVINSVSTFAGILCLTTALPAYGRERPVVYREAKGNGTYNIHAYSAAIGIAELPWMLFLSLVVQSISYFLIGLPADAASFFTLLLMTIGVCAAFSYQAHLFVALFPSVELASIFMGISISIINMFSGIFIEVAAMPAGWKGMYYAVVTSHALRLGSTTVFHCEGGAAAGCPQISAVVNGVPTSVDASTFVEERLGITYDRRWESLGCIVLIATLFRVASMLAYRYLNWQKR